MGMGDEIMAAGVAARIHRERGVPVRIVGVDGAPRWSELWRDNPAIEQRGDPRGDSEVLVNGPGARPYIERWEQSEERSRLVFRRDWRARDHRGEIFLSALERAAAVEVAPKAPFMVLEHRVRGASSPNKDWGAERWQRVVDLLAGQVAFVTFVQAADEDPGIKGTLTIVTSSFRLACAVLERSAGYVGPEGGLHHAAAALRRPAVVVFGGFVHPSNTGYEDHANLYTSPEGPCGRWAPCATCRDALDRIHPAEVAVAAGRIFELERIDPRRTR